MKWKSEAAVGPGPAFQGVDRGMEIFHSSQLVHDIGRESLAKVVVVRPQSEANVIGPADETESRWVHPVGDWSQVVSTLISSPRRD